MTVLNMFSNAGIIFIVLLGCLIAVVIWLYIFNIYEVSISYAINSNGMYEIEAVALNSFGYKAPLRKCECKFEIVAGIEFVKVIEEDVQNGKFIIEPLVNGQEILIRASSKLSLRKSEIKIHLNKKEGS